MRVLLLNTTKNFSCQWPTEGRIQMVLSFSCKYLWSDSWKHFSWCVIFLCACPWSLISRGGPHKGWAFLKKGEQGVVEEGNIIERGVELYYWSFQMLKNLSRRQEPVWRGGVSTGHIGTIWPSKCVGLSNKTSPGVCRYKKWVSNGKHKSCSLVESQLNVKGMMQ